MTDKIPDIWHGIINLLKSWGGGGGGGGGWTLPYKEFAKHYL